MRKASQLARVLMLAVEQVSAFCRRPVLTGLKWEGFVQRLVTWPQEVLQLNLPRKLARALVPAGRGEPAMWSTIEGLEPRVLLSTLYWDTDQNTAGLQAGNGTWDSVTWATDANGGGHRGWQAGDDAIFAAAGTSTVTVAGSMQVGSVTFSASGYTVSGGTLGLGGGSITASQNATISSVISGTAGLRKDGAATLTLSGSNSFGGTATVAQGVLKLASTGALGTGGNAVNVSGVLDVGGQSISGYTLTLGGTLSNSGSAATWTGDIALNAASTFVTTGGLTVAGTISGGYGVTKSGTGTLTFWRANTYSGTTSIGSGVLQLGDGSNSTNNGSVGGELAIGSGTLTFNPSGSQTFSQTISGTGTMIKTGSGTLVLSGTNSHTGSLSIAGRVQLDADEALASGSGTVSLNGGILDLHGHDVVGRPVLPVMGSLITSIGSATWSGAFYMPSGIPYPSTIGGDGTLTIGTITGLQGASGNSLQAGGIGPLISLAGTLVKTGAGTAVIRSLSNTAPAPLSVQSGTLKLGSSSLLLYTVNVQSGATLDLGGYSVSANSLNLSQASLVNSSATPSTLSIGVALIGSCTVGGSGNLVLNGVVSGASGSLVKSGSGTVVLGGTNTYTGGTSLAGGVLSVGVNQNLGNTSGTVSFAGGSLRVTGSTMHDWGTRTVNGATFNGGMDIADASNAFTIGSTLTGSGSLTKVGPGTLVLGSPVSLTGGTTINAGTLQLSDAYGPGPLTISAGVLALSASGGVHTVENVITGAGSVSKSGAGTIMLIASNDYSGGTTISGGTLQLGDGSDLGTAGSGTITVTGGVLAFNTPVGSQTISNVITGAGSVRKSGSGTVVLTQTSSYSGGTTLSAGTLQLGDGLDGHNGSLAGTVTVSSGATLVLQPYGSQSFASNFAGSGTISKLGTGTATLSANSTFAGNVSVSAGSLVVSATHATLGTLTVGAAGYAALATGGNKLLSLTTLSVDSGGRLELADNGVAVADTNLYSTLWGLESAGSPGVISSIGPGNPASDQTAGLFVNDGSPLPVTNFYGTTLTSPALLLQALPAVASFTWSEGSPTDANTLHAVVEFNQPVTGVTDDAFDLQNWPTSQHGSITAAAITDVTGSGSTYTLTVSTGGASGNGTLRLVLSDTAGSIFSSGSIGLGYNSTIGGKGVTTGTLVVDKRPVVTDITLLDPAQSSQAVVDFQVTFSEDVDGVDASEFSLTGNISDASLRSVTALDGTRVFLVSVNSGTGSGSLGLSVDGAGITDQDGTPDAFAGPTESDYYTFAAHTVSNLTAQGVASDQVHLQWENSVNDDASLEIFYRETNGSGGFVSAGNAPGNTNSYDVTGLSPQTLYTFKVVASQVRNGGTSTSNTAQGTTLASGEVSPLSNLQATGSYTFSNGTTSMPVTLTWQETGLTDTDVVHYAVEVKIGDVENFWTPGVWTSLLASGTSTRTLQVDLGSLVNTQDKPFEVACLLDVPLTFRIVSQRANQFVYSDPVTVQVNSPSVIAGAKSAVYNTTLTNYYAYELYVYQDNGTPLTDDQIRNFQWDSSNGSYYQLQFQYVDSPNPSLWYNQTVGYHLAFEIEKTVPSWAGIRLRVVNLQNGHASASFAPPDCNDASVPYNTLANGPTNLQGEWLQVNETWTLRLSWQDNDYQAGDQYYVFRPSMFVGSGTEDDYGPLQYSTTTMSLELTNAGTWPEGKNGFWAVGKYRPSTMGGIYAGSKSAWTWAEILKPAKPDTPVVRQVTDTSAELSWIDRSYNEQGFLIEQSDAAGTVWDAIGWVPADTTHYRISGLTVGADYQFRVWSSTESVLNGPSAAVSLHTQTGRGYCATCQNGWGGPIAGDTGAQSPQTTGSGSTVNGILGVPVGNSGLAGSLLGQSTLWTNQESLPAGSNGSGVVVSTKPTLQKLADNVIRITNGASVFTFDLIGGNYVSRYSSWESLSRDTINHRYVMTDSQGNQTRFYDEDLSNGTNAYKLLDFTSTAGPTIQASGSDETYQVNGNTIEKRITTSTGGRVSSVALQRLVNSTLTLVRTIEYSYYDDNSPNGNDGDLQSTTTRDAGGTILEQTYYRYYKANDPKGYAHGLKFSLGSDAFQRLVQSLAGSGYTYDTAPDALVARYADEYYEYDDRRRVITTVRAGTGSSDDYGRGTFTYVYFERAVTNDYNIWKFKTIESLPGYNLANPADPANTRTVYYANYAGQIMLKLTQSPDGSGGWQDLQRVFYHYDTQGRVDYSASGAAITGYSEACDDLLHNTGGNYEYLADDQGLVLWTSYDGASGFAFDQKVSHGETATRILQSQTTYTAHSAGGQTIYLPASSSVYSETGGSGARTTTYQYGLKGEDTPNPSDDSLAIVWQKTTAPTVTYQHNGSDTAAVTWTFYDAAGRVTWTRDALGVLSHLEYDATGNLVTSIQDYHTDGTHPGPVNPDDPGTTFSTPTGYGLNLVTQYTYEPLGRIQSVRIQRVTDPGDQVTWMLYNDAAHETLTYNGWHQIDSTGSYTSTGPVVISRTGYGSQSENGTLTGYSYLESRTAAALVRTSTTPTGDESSSTPLSLSRTFYNAGDQMVESDSYYSFTGANLNDLHPGSASSNYLRTQYRYDSRGRQARSVNPAGTIERFVFDNLGQTLSTWIGTDDTVGTGLIWSPENNATGTSNMVQTSASVYQNELLIHQEQLRHVTGQPDLVTDYQYDWQNRLVATKQGASPLGPSAETDSVHRPLIVQEYDNLGEVLGTFTYDGDGLNLADFADGPKSGGAILHPEHLVGHYFQVYDELGQVYQSTIDSVSYNSGTGSLTLTPVASTYSWFDANSQLLKTLLPNGLATKYQHDGAGRTTFLYQTDAGGDPAPGDTGTWEAARTLAGDHVLRQTEQQYDEAGNVLFTITKERRYEATSTEALLDSDARVTYRAAYFDQANRLLESADYGTNDYGTGNDPTMTERPGTLPQRTDSYPPLITTYTYDDAGRLQTVTDPRNIATRTEYDALGRTLKTIASYGTGALDLNQTTEYLYDSAGRLELITQDMDVGPDHVTQYVYGVTTSGTYASAIYSNDLVSLVKYPDPITGNPSTLSQDQVHYAYDAQGQVIRQNTLSGATLTTGFDSVGRRTSQSATDGSITRTLSYGYDALGRLMTQTDADLHTTTYAYDALGRVLLEQRPDPDTTTTQPPTTYSYDPAGAYMEVTNAAGHTTRSDYDLLGRVVQVTGVAPGSNPDIKPITTYHYNVRGDRTTRTDPLGLVVTETILDRFGQIAEERSTDTTGQTPSSLTYSGGTVTVYLAAHGYQVHDAVVVEGGNQTGYAGVFVVTSITSDSFTYLLPATPGGTLATGATIYKAHERVTYTYDADGNVLSLTDPNGNATTYLYDNLNRVTTETNARNDARLYTYDAANNVLSITDREGFTREFSYDARNRRTDERWDEKVAVLTPTTLSASGTVATLTYASGTFYAGNLICVHGADQGIFNGVFEVTSATNGTLTYTLPSSYTGTATGTLQVQKVGRDLAYGYDAGGRVRTITERMANNTQATSNTYGFDYDAFGQLTEETSTRAALNSNGTTLTVGYTYDTVGRRSTLDATVGATADVANVYDYDAQNRLTTLTQSGAAVGKRVIWAYNALGQIDTITREQGVYTVGSTAYGYDLADRLSGLSHTVSGSLRSYSLDLDLESRVGTLTSSVDGTITYGHDATGQLLSADDGGSVDEDYAYDAAGNRRGTGISVDTDNRLVADGTYTYGYDKEGNRSWREKHDGLVLREHIDYIWDYRNRLESVTIATYDAGGNPSGTMQVLFTYDPLDRRIEKTVNVGAVTPVHEHYVWDGDNLLLVLNNSAGVTQRFLTGLQINEVLAQETPGTAPEVLWTFTDHLGSMRDVAQVVSGTAQWTGHVAYDSFGNAAPAGAAQNQRMLYTGQQYDPETGLYYYHTRYYDPVNGVFIGQDPLKFAARDSNLSRYVGNSPMTETDSSGLILDIPPAMDPTLITSGITSATATPLYDDKVMAASTVTHDMNDLGSQLISEVAEKRTLDERFIKTIHEFEEPRPEHGLFNGFDNLPFSSAPEWDLATLQGSPLVSDSASQPGVWDKLEDGIGFAAATAIRQGYASVNVSGKFPLLPLGPFGVIEFYYDVGANLGLYCDGDGGKILTLDLSATAGVTAGLGNIIGGRVGTKYSRVHEKGPNKGKRTLHSAKGDMSGPKRGQFIKKADARHNGFDKWLDGIDISKLGSSDEKLELDSENWFDGDITFSVYAFAKAQAFIGVAEANVTLGEYSIKDGGKWKFEPEYQVGLTADLGIGAEIGVGGEAAFEGKIMLHHFKGA